MEISCINTKTCKGQIILRNTHDKNKIPLNNDCCNLFSIPQSTQGQESAATAKDIFSNEAGIEDWIKQKKVPVLGIGLIEGHQLKQIRIYGELTKGVSAPYNTIFNVASLTKPVNAMVALKLVSQGKLSLDEPLYKYWTDPDIASDPRNKKITARLILSHQTGFANWRWMNGGKKLKFEFDRGTRYQYSGEGLEYLRIALEKKFKNRCSF